MKKNSLVTIGFIGSRNCYLNVDLEDAIERYIKDEDITEDEFYEYETPFEEFEFEDEFTAYEIWEVIK